MTRLGTARRPWEWTLPCVVYSVFDAQARPLYVGHTANISDRMRSPAHRADCPATHYPDRPERCRCVFMAMIEEMRPAHGEGMRDV